MNDLVKNKFALLAIVVLLALALTACGEETTPPDVTSSVTSGVVADNADALVIAEKDKTVFKVVLSYRAIRSETDLAEKLLAKLSEDHGVELELTDDFNADDPWNKEKVENDEYEILIGKTNRKEAADVETLIGMESDWMVRVSGKKIIIAADSAKGYGRAYDYFISRLSISENGTLSIPKNTDKTVTITQNEFLLSLLNDYKVVCESKNERVGRAFEKFVMKVNDLTKDADLQISDKSGDESVKELIIRDQYAKNSYKLSYYDYVIIENDNKIEVVAPSPLAIVNALDSLYELIIWQDFNDQYVFRFSTDNYNPIINDQGLFQPKWAGSITVPSWMTDFNEKLYALTYPSGRHMSVAHRGDVIYYPEDSLEGILSAALLGADVIELDLQLTRDNVIVICHDDTLTKTTNVKEMKGKDGLPNSEKIADWTYEQLTKLSLLDGRGQLTEYKLPTLYEIIAVAKDKCFLMFDDKTGFTRDDILPMEMELDACEVSIYSMFVSSASGTAANNSFDVIKKFSNEHPEMTKLAGNVAKVSKYLAMNGHRIRTRNWLYDDATTDWSIESEEAYITAYKKGKNLLYTNNIPLFSQYLAKNYTASKLPS